MKTEFYKCSTKMGKIYNTTIKGLLFVVFSFLVSNQVNGQYNDSIPQKCNSVVNGTEVITHSMTPVGATGNAMLTIYYEGDFGSTGEFLEVYSETGGFLKKLNGSTSDCNVAPTETISLHIDSINAWAVDGTISFTYTAANATTAVNTICGPGFNASFCVTPVLSYNYALGPNNVGVSSIDSPSNFCAGVHNVKATIHNFGTNQVNSLTVDWTIDGVLQTPYTFSGTLDTAGGSGSINAQVLLGTHNFAPNQNYTIKAWTSNPNGIQDTSNINDTATQVVGAAMSGIVTVGGAGADFATIGAAVNALNANGLCGPLTVNIAPGTYNEQIVIGQINGASATNTLTFNGAGIGNTILQHNATGSTDRITLQLDGAVYTTWRNMTVAALNPTYGFGVHLTNQANYNTLDSIAVEVAHFPTTSNVAGIVASGSSTSTGTSGDNANNTTISNSTVSGGYYGILLRGAGTTSPNDSNMIINTRVTDFYYYGMYLYYQNLFKLYDNHVEYGIGSSNFGFALYSGYTSQYDISRNYFKGASDGMYMFNTTYINTLPSYITNNMVMSGDDAAMYIDDGDNLNIYHNSTYSETNYGIEFNSTDANVDVKNNIFTSGSNYALFSDATNMTLDYNNYFRYDNGTLVDHQTTYATLAAWQAACACNLNSVSVKPFFRSFTDLHANLPVNNLGTPLPSVTVDFDGQPRSTTAPDLGADEFTPTPIDLASIEIISPVEGCGLSSSESVTFSMMNFGLNNLTAGQAIPVSYQINNNPVVTESYTLAGNLPSLAITNFTFNTPADLSDSSTFTLKVWTSITGDGNRENDTTTVVIRNSVVKSFSWIEDFEDMTIGATSRYGRGWLVPGESDQAWTIGSGQTPSGPNTGPFHDFNPKTFSGKYLYMETNSGSSGSEFIVGSPCINISSLTNPGINFAYHMYGTGIGSLHLDIVTADSTFRNVWEMIGDQGNQWHQAVVDLSPFSGSDIVQLQFRGVRGGSTLGDIAIDDIRVGNIPSLNFPSTINDCGFVRLDAGNPGSTYDWSTGDTTRRIEIISGPVAVTRNVSLLVTTADGMMNLADFEVVLAPGPYVNLGNDTIVCDQPSFTLDAGNVGATYEWDNGSQNQTRDITSSGTYFVEVDHINCVKGDTIEVTMSESPVATFTYVDDPNTGVTTFNSTGSIGNSYRWLFGDGFGSNVANPTHQYTSPADSFLVTLIVSNICGTDTLRQMVTNINTGIEDLASITAADVYPNPSNGKFTVDVETAKVTDIELTVFNMQGQLLSISKFEKTSKLTNELDLNDQAKGVYYLKIKAGNEVTVKKLVIQ